MDNIVKDLNPRQKARMHQVADGMLLIYNTLVRMRFLLPSWVQQGPHDVDHLLPLYQSLDLDASVIYLYSILPYVDNAGAEGIDFLMGGEFADFRQRRDIEQARNPMCGDESELMRPWMTALSHIGNHDCAIIYDARKHRIGIFNQMDSSGSRDHNIHEGWTITYSTDGENVNTHLSRPLESEEKSDEEEEEEEGSGEQSDNDDDDDDDDDDDEEDDEDGDDGADECIWDDQMDETNTRPAPNVLRDIVIWYEDLTETPGGGEQSSGMWHQESVKSLYQKHGWPTPTFDGDAFLTDMLRVEAAALAQWSFEAPARELHALTYGREADDDARTRAMMDRLAAAKGLDEEWAVRWDLFVEQMNKPGAGKRIADLQLKVQEQKEPSSEDLLFAELKRLHESWQYQSRKLKELQEQMDSAPVSDGQEGPGRKLQLRHEWARCQVQNYQRAYEACRADCERDYPSGLATLERELERAALADSNPNYEGQIKSLTESIDASEKEITAIQQWIGQLPEEAKQARKVAEWTVGNKRKAVEIFTTQRDGCVASLREADSLLG